MFVVNTLLKIKPTTPTTVILAIIQSTLENCEIEGCTSTACEYNGCEAYATMSEGAKGKVIEVGENLMKQLIDEGWI